MSDGKKLGFEQLIDNLKQLISICSVLIAGVFTTLLSYPNAKAASTIGFVSVLLAGFSIVLSLMFQIYVAEKNLDQAASKWISYKALFIMAWVLFLASVVLAAKFISNVI